MLVKRAYRFRLEPNPDQYTAFERCAGSCRFVYNWMLQQRSDYYKATGKGVGRMEQDRQLKPMKKQYTWLAEAPSQILQQCLKDLDQAYRNFFEGRAAYPTFRKKGLNDGFRFPQGFKVVNNYIRLPKVGMVKIRLSRAIKGVPKNVTVSRRGKHWYASIQVEEVLNLPVSTGEPVGIDRGITDMLALSNGTTVPPIDFSAQNKKKRRIQRTLSRRKKGSTRWKKAKADLNRINQRIADKRLDYLHKTSTQLSKKHALIALEDLGIGNMTGSARGTLENPGKNVKAKAGLNRRILEQGWGIFATLLQYKLDWRGGKLVKVPAPYTSQTCSVCGHRAKENRKDKHFKCVNCGHAEDADIQAAKNILALAVGQTVSARGVIRPVAA